MSIPSNLTHLNKTTMDIYVHVSEERLSETTFNASHINLTDWTVQSFDELNMTIQLNFSCPLCISPKIVQDELVINFHGIKMHSKDGRQINKQYDIMKASIRPQLDGNPAT